MFLSDMSPWLVCCCYKITKKEIGFALHPRLPGGETFRNRVPNMNSINATEAGSARGGFAAHHTTSRFSGKGNLKKVCLASQLVL